MQVPVDGILKILLQDFRGSIITASDKYKECSKNRDFSL
jgi:hypothetical protein